MRNCQSKNTLYPPPQPQITSQILLLECGTHIHTEKDVLMKVYLIHGVPETLYGSNKQYGTLKTGAQKKTTNTSGSFLIFLQAAGSKRGNSIFSQFA